MTSSLNFRSLNFQRHKNFHRHKKGYGAVGASFWAALVLIVFLLSFGGIAQPVSAQDDLPDSPADEPAEIEMPQDPSWTIDDLFTVSNKSDQTYQILVQLFGQVMDSDLPAGATVLGDVFRVYTSFILALAYIWVVYLVVTGIVSGARSGSLFGQSVNGTWGAVRLSGAMSMLIPTTNGYPFVVKLVLIAASFGIQFGNAVWETAVDSLADGKTITAPHPHSTYQMAEKIYLMALCKNLYNENLSFHAGYNTDETYIMGFDYPEGEVGLAAPLYISTSETAIANKADCGRVIIDFKSLVDDATASEADMQDKLKEVREQHQMGVLRVLAAADDLAGYVAKVVAHSYKVQKGKSELGDVASFEKTAQEMMRRMPQQYSAEMVKSIMYYDMIGMYTGEKLITDKDRSFAETYRDKAVAGGWSKAGQYWVKISKINGTSLHYSRYRPVVTSANMDTVYKPRKTVVNIVDAAIKMSAPLWNQTLSGMTGQGLHFTEDGKVYDPTDIQVSDVATGGILNLFGHLKGFFRFFTQEGMIDNFGAGSGDREAVLQSYDTVDLGSSWEELYPSETFENGTGKAKKAVNGVLPSFGDGTLDPVGRITKMGHTLILGTETFFIANAFLRAAIFVGDAALQLAGGGAKALVSMFAADALGGFKDAMISLFDSYYSIMGPLAWIVMGAGIYMAFVLPFQIWLHYFLAVMGWIILIIEAAIAAPLFMIAHINFGGTHLIEGQMKRGWMILLTIMLKPALIVLGFIFSMVMLYVATSVIQSELGSVVTNVQGNHFSGPISLVVTLALIVTSLLLVARLCFRMMTTIPDTLLQRWLGAPDTSMVDHNAVADTSSHFGGISGRMADLDPLKPNPGGGSGGSGAIGGVGGHGGGATGNSGKGASKAAGLSLGRKGIARAATKAIIKK